MLALAIAISLALHGDPFVQNASVQTVAPLTQAGGQAPQGLIPFGQALGTYTAPTWLANGSLLALLEDAAGNPLWVLDAEIQGSGAVSGQLSVLRYSSNPAGGMVQLAVTGHVLFDDSNAGVFSATIYSLSVGAVPIYPMGKIEGALKPDAIIGVTPTLAGKSGLVAMAFDAHAQDLPHSPIAPTLARGGGMIVCPKGPDASIAKIQKAKNLAQASANIPSVDPLGHVITCPKGPDFGIGSVQSAGNMAQSGVAGAFGQGVTKPYLYVDPQGYQGPVVSAQTAAGAHAQLGQGFAAGKQGVVCLRWWLQP